MALISLENTVTIALSVKDRHKSAEWYESVLGFQTIYHSDDAGWSEMQTKTEGVTLGLGEHTQPVPGNCVPVFETADLDRDREVLENASIRFDGPTVVIEGMVKTATLYDPDGNALMLAEDLANAGDHFPV